MEIATRYEYSYRITIAANSKLKSQNSKLSMDIQSAIFRLLIFLPAIISALTIHEFAHAWAGNRLGDDTARREGRLTIDPAVHLDPFGSLFIVLGALTGAPLIGWAKPVPFNPRNLRHPARDSALIALAGPVSNILQVPIWLGLLFVLRIAAGENRFEFFVGLDAALRGNPGSGNVLAIFGAVLVAGVILNVSLAVFNMIPIPPLDGHYILEAFGPPSVAQFFDAIRPMSFILLYGLMLTGVIRLIMNPVRDFAEIQLIGRALGLV
jgi:Zn-dependent protease